jgi:UDP:flavonoid glycosyltransferase YjiC (YdhE family)
LGKPFVLAYLQPILPSRELPPVTLPPRELPGWANLLLHHAARVAQWQVLQPAFNRHVRPGLGLPRYPWHGPRYAVGQAACPVLLGYSRHAVPRPRAWPEHVRVTGYWFLDEEETWSPPRGLVEFLDTGPPPIYIGFGSMPSRDPEAATRLVVEAIRRSGQRAVLATGWNGLREPPQGLGDGICVIREAPHAWLFRRVALAVHHGGGGTTAAAIRAGIPSVVVPFLADQPFWAWQMAWLGVAPPGLNHKTLTPEQLARTIMVAAGAEMRDRAKQLGDHILEEDGIHAATMALAEWGLLPAPAAWGCYRGAVE